MKFKDLASGILERCKARTVAGGNLIDRSAVDETRAPTVGIMTVLSIISMATSCNMGMETADIDGAFLIPEMAPNAVRRHVRIDRVMSSLMVERYPELSPYLCSDGTLVLRLLKYLYGLPEAAYQFYKYMERYLTSIGFIATNEDQCVFVRGKGKDTVWIALLVDDLLIVEQDEARSKFRTQLESKFKIKCQTGERLSYIGLDIKRMPNGDRVVAQGGCLKNILERFADDIKKYPRVPRLPGTQAAFTVKDRKVRRVTVFKFQLTLK